MGIDLEILPLRDREQLAQKTVLCYDRIRFNREYEIFGQIANPDGESVMPDEGIEAVVKTFPLPPGLFLEVYGDKGIKKTRQNPYGEEMVYTFAENMRNLKPHKEASARNKAIIAYLKKLEPDTPIILQWR